MNNENEYPIEENYDPKYREIDWNSTDEEEILSKFSEIVQDENGNKYRVFYFDENYNLSSKDKAAYARKELIGQDGKYIKTEVSELKMM